MSVNSVNGQTGDVSLKPEDLAVSGSTQSVMIVDTLGNVSFISFAMDDPNLYLNAQGEFVVPTKKGARIEVDENTLTIDSSFIQDLLVYLSSNNSSAPLTTIEATEQDGQILYLRRDPLVDDDIPSGVEEGGNILLESSFSFGSVGDASQLALQYNQSISKWMEIGRR